MAQVFLHWCLRNKSLEPLYILIPHQDLSMGLWPMIHMISPKQMTVHSLLPTLIKTRGTLDKSEV